MEEGSTQDQGTQDAGQDGNQATLAGSDGSAGGNWYDSLGDADLRNNATLQKYTSAEEAHKGHLKLQESFGMEKVVWPKDENDTERWAEVNKRLGVPSDAAGYNLEAIANPEGTELFDRAGFQQMMKDVAAPKTVAEKLWSSYTDKVKGQYAEAKATFDNNVQAASNALKQEWGDAYESKINRGQAVIDSFADSDAQKDALTVALSQTTEGIRFLAGIGDLMAESSIGGFQEKQNFTYTPDEARRELDIIKANPDYHSDDPRVRQPLIDRSNDLMRMINPSM